MDPTLIPLDGSDLSEGILQPIAPLLHGKGSEVTLLRVISRVGTGPEQAEDLDGADEQLNRVAAALRTQGLRVTLRLERGEPAERILEVAETTGVKLIAMTTHGRTGAARLLRGSVAERVVRSSNVPVLLCNPEALAKQAPGEYFRHILVPLDGSERSDRILPLVSDLALHSRSRVTLLRIQPIIYTPVPSPLVRGELWSEQRTRDSLAPQESALRASGIDVDVRAEYGVEALEILAAARETDLVAMTTHGRSGISRWWFGSVAESVVRHCPCPLLVLRTQES